MIWRQGNHVPHHVYVQDGPEPNSAPWPDGDRPVATFSNPEDAEKACTAVNAMGDPPRKLSVADLAAIRAKVRGRSRAFAEKIQPVYVALHWLWSSANDVPSVDQIEQAINSLADGLEPDSVSIGSGGLRIYLERETFEVTVDLALEMTEQL